MLLVFPVDGTYGLESSSLGLPVVWRVVVDSQAAILASQPEVGQLRDPLEGTVAGAEVETRGPVVGEVVGVRARGASGKGARVVSPWSHGGVERVAASDLVDVGRWHRAWLDKRVETLDGQLRTFESHEGGLVLAFFDRRGR